MVRSPLGRYGRLLTLGFGVLTLAAAPGTSISPSVAGLYVGEHRVIEGPVSTAERDGATVRLHLGNKPPELIVSLIIGLLSTFPSDPEHYYTGKTIRVSGTIREFRGRPEIVVHDAGDIQLVGAAPAIVATPNTGTEVEQLRERVRQLDQRVHELEGSHLPASSQ